MPEQATRGIPVPPPGMLPHGYGVRLADHAKVCDGGRSLVGASVLYLSPEAARVVAALPGVPADDTGRTVARLLLDRGLADPWWPTPAGLDREVDDVTVVVPVRDRPLALARVLGALPRGVPVVVVDDGSEDPPTVASVARRHDARLVVHDHNRGPAAARNSGLRAAGTPFVAFVDSDVVPEPGWLGVLRRHLDDPALALVAPRILGPEPQAGDSWVERYEQARSSLDLGPRPGAVRVHGAVSYLPTACVLARVSALGAGFDETMRVGEDVDLVWRLLEAGWGVRYEPAATVRHRHRAAVGEWLRRKAFYGTSAAPLAARHAGAVSPMVLAPWSAALAVALLAQRRWSLPVALAAWAAATAGTARRLGRSDHPLTAAATLTAQGAVGTLWQTGAALTRHYWPLAAVACLGSRRARRAVVVAAVVDGLADHRRTHPRLDPMRYVVARRLDDLAYGAGVWEGVVRARSVRALLPEQRGWPRRRSGPRGRTGRRPAVPAGRDPGGASSRRAGHQLWRRPRSGSGWAESRMT